MTNYRLGVVMDPIARIKPVKDTTLALLLEAQARGYALHYFELPDLYLDNGRAGGRSRRLELRDDTADWHTLSAPQTLWLDELDVILMRKDPPVDREYLYATHLLECAERAGVLVVNRPAALRDINEKLALAEFAEFAAPTRVDSDMQRLRAFVQEHGDTVIKPLDGMGGASIFRLRRDDPNLGVVLETLTGHGRHLAMIQRYLPAIREGDKRILLIDGEPWPHALARIPGDGETRGNLAAGGRGVGRPLDDRDREIAAALGPTLRDRGLLFVGLDVIGDSLTEVNVTSPTCVRELDREYGSNIAAELFVAIEKRLPSPAR